MTHLLRGAVAGAAGTTALNTVTYLDMALRARPASTTPEETVKRMEEVAGARLSRAGRDSGEEANRRSGLGPLLGIATGVAAGTLYGAVRSRWPRLPVALLAVGAGAAANLGSTAPMTALGVTDPREWSATSWISDLVPHLAFGVVTALAYELSEAGGEADAS
ncbi:MULTISPECIES: hypothetical protein [Nocardiopsis]|uniref:Putative outer membrane lipoprotein n=1 Tax=Nocardiopsis sinuspersici TaxID=501010 RepID=A0A1V3BYC3_9ACTN|nr:MULTISPECIES: hypothetical protein [Nocardiopsis]NYH54463.1 putative outer membrane lipoprotein [Nocardiopsis sinuspersici]OOC53246.1 hypothetical protein NOSIN_04960 [Nocardiopsis sinuspersici]